MKYGTVEHFDHFYDETIFWIDMLDPPESVQLAAEEIDGENYNPSCFGMCVYFDTSNKEFDIVTDTDVGTGEQRNIYYIDNNGDKRWFAVSLPGELVEQVFSACRDIIMGKSMAAGYQVRQSIALGNNFGFVLGERATENRPFQTARYNIDEHGRYDYCEEKTFSDRLAAEKDYSSRAERYWQSRSIRSNRSDISQNRISRKER